MIRQRSSILLGLLLLVTAACSKKKDPEPKLEGTWTVQYTDNTKFNADGSVQSTSTDTPFAPTTYTFTSSELKVMEGSRSNAFTYTREQTILRCQHAGGNTFDLLITTLAKSELVLEQASGFGPAGYTRSVIHLTR